MHERRSYTIFVYATTTKGRWHASAPVSFSIREAHALQPIVTMTRSLSGCDSMNLLLCLLSLYVDPFLYYWYRKPNCLTERIVVHNIDNIFAKIITLLYIMYVAFLQHTYKKHSRLMSALLSCSLTVHRVCNVLPLAAGTRCQHLPWPVLVCLMHHRLLVMVS